MNKNQFLANLKDELELEIEINLDTNLKELDEWDSVLAMVLIGFVLDNFAEFNDFVQIILNTKNYSDFSRNSRNSSVARFNPEFISNSYLKLYNAL